ncbi:MAG: type VI secretion system tip protein VgrG [Planctomycetes bacterium]|nr:type VI secretion system tip protein VgrG [Planctomycetota bacterium]
MVMLSSTRRGRVLRFSSDAVDRNTLLVASFEGDEAISKPYSFALTLLSKMADLDSAALLRKPACLGIKQPLAPKSGKGPGLRTLPIHGVLSSFQQCEKAGDWVLYRAILVPRLARLALNRQYRVFLSLSVPEIVEQVLKDAGLTKDDYEFRTSARSYRKREQTVQYRETDLDFVSRLLEHEGIFYFFEQTEGCEKVIFGDSPSAYSTVPTDAAIPYRPDAFGKRRDAGKSRPVDWFEQEIVGKFMCEHRLVPTEVVLRDYNYAQPSLDLKVTEKAGGGFGKIYEYGGEYLDTSEGAALAKARAEEIRCRERLFPGVGDVRSFRAGMTFELADHYRADFNATYLITHVRHEAEQAIALAEPGSPVASYRNEFVAIPADLAFRPERTTPAPRIAGTISGKVDASGGGEYAEIDEHGRYKVILPFDLSGKGGGTASRYVRMAQPYAGAEYGMHFPLHKGTEVILGFEEGNPDLPVIAGAIPNPETASPVTAGSHTKCVIKTGSDNRIEMEDEKGSERIKISTPYGESFVQLGSKNDPNEGVAIKSLKSLIFATDEDSNAMAKGDMTWVGSLLNMCSKSGVNIYGGVLAGVGSALATGLTEVTRELLGEDAAKAATFAADTALSAAVVEAQATMSAAGATKGRLSLSYVADVLWPDVTIIGDGGVNLLGIGPQGAIHIGSHAGGSTLYGATGVNVVSPAGVTVVGKLQGVELCQSTDNKVKIDSTAFWAESASAKVIARGEFAITSTGGEGTVQAKKDLRLESTDSKKIVLKAGGSTITLEDKKITLESKEILLKANENKSKLTLASNFAVETKGSHLLDTKGEIKLKSAKKLLLHSDSTFVIEAKKVDATKGGKKDLKELVVK